MTQRLVSIVTPTYNQAQFLEATIASVLAQTYPNIEYIILDDGSTDETPQILEKYRDTGIIIERQQNIGQTATINKGWARSTGDIIAWLNSDDVLVPSAVEEAVSAFEQHPEALAVYGNCRQIDIAGALLKPYLVKQIDLNFLLFSYDELPVSQPSTFLRRAVLDLVGFLDQDIYYCMDLDYWIRIVSAGGMIYIDGRSWSDTRVHPQAKSYSPTARSRAAADYIYVYQKYFARPDLPEHLRRMRGKGIALAHWQAARRLLGSAPRSVIIKHIALSLLHDPNPASIWNRLNRAGRIALRRV